MENKEQINNQVSTAAPTPQVAPQQDNNLLLDELRRLSLKMQEMELKNLKLQQQTEHVIPQNNLRLYDQNSTTHTQVKNLEEETPLKTIGELRAEQRAKLSEERQQFLYDQQFGTPITRDQKYGRNKIHYEECAALMMYENGDERFRAIVQDKIDMLRECRYIDLAETTLWENQGASRMYTDLFGESIPFIDEKNDILKHKVNELSMYRQ